MDKNKFKELAEVMADKVKVLMSESEPSQVDKLIEYINRDFLDAYGLAVVRMAEVEEVQAVYE